MSVIAIALKRVLTCLFPTKKDSVAQIVIKMAYLLLIIAVGIAVCLFADRLAFSANQKKIVSDSAVKWNDKENNYGVRMNLLKAENSDFVGWLQVGDLIGNPVYQAKDNEFYKTHNSKCEESEYGALYLSSEDRVSGDDNITIYGNNMSDGAMFGALSQLRDGSAFVKNGYITFSTEKENENYAIFSVMLLTENADDDNGAPFDFYKTKFDSVYEFGKWRDEAVQRSIISTGVNLKYDDKRLLLVADADDFEGAKLVVMAKKVEDISEMAPDVKKVKVNEEARYPKVWYDQRKLDYPY